MCEQTHGYVRSADSIKGDEEVSVDIIGWWWLVFALHAVRVDVIHNHSRSILPKLEEQHEVGHSSSELPDPHQERRY